MSSTTGPLVHEDAIDFLTADHEAGQALFDIYESVAVEGSAADKSGLASCICAQLLAHVRLEEELFLPAVRRDIGEQALDESLAALAEAKKLIHRVAALQPADIRYDSTMAALGDCFRAHIQHENARVFPQAAGSTVDLQTLRTALAARRTAMLVGQGAD